MWCYTLMSCYKLLYELLLILDTRHECRVSYISESQTWLRVRANINHYLSHTHDTYMIYMTHGTRMHSWCYYTWLLHIITTPHPTWGHIFECSFKAQSSKLEGLLSLKRGQRDVRALSFELSKMWPQVGLAVPVTRFDESDESCHTYKSFNTHINHLKSHPL